MDNLISVPIPEDHDTARWLRQVGGNWTWEKVGDTTVNYFSEDNQLLAQLDYDNATSRITHLRVVPGLPPITRTSHES